MLCFDHPPVARGVAGVPEADAAFRCRLERRCHSGQGELDPARLVFADETGTFTNMARLRGRGKRVIGRVPWGHWKTLTFVAGLRQGEVTAPFVTDRAMNGAIFVE
jgi:hypothetical protein